jgi:MFS family permease
MSSAAAPKHILAAIKRFIFLMFMMFAMTTDSVGLIIPEAIKEFHLSMTAAGSFHYANMIAIAVAAIFLVNLAEEFGRKETIILGLIPFALNSHLFAAGNAFLFFLILLVISGTAIGIPLVNLSWTRRSRLRRYLFREKGVGNENASDHSSGNSCRHAILWRFCTSFCTGYGYRF